MIQGFTEGACITFNETFNFDNDFFSSCQNVGHYINVGNNSSYQENTHRDDHTLTTYQIGRIITVAVTVELRLTTTSLLRPLFCALNEWKVYSFP